MFSIEKTEFMKHMDHIMAIMDMQDDIGDIGRGKYGTQFMFELTFPTLIDDVIELLEAATNDEDDNIQYFLFELDCGRQWKPGMVVTADGTDIPMKTLDDLWNILVEDEERRTNQEPTF